MTLAELNNILKQTQLPVAYDHFPESENVKPPCIVYNVAFTSNFGADNRVFSPFTHVDIHLYEYLKNEAESLLETVLNEASIFWDKTETWENEEKAYHIIYEVTINGN